MNVAAPSFPSESPRPVGPLSQYVPGFNAAIAGPWGSADQKRNIAYGSVNVTDFKSQPVALAYLESWSDESVMCNCMKNRGEGRTP